MRMKLGYGKQSKELHLTSSRKIDTIRYQALDQTEHAELSDVNRIEQAINAPIHTPRLEQLARGKHNAVILISDKSRLAPSYLFIGPILDRLNQAGIPDTHIKIIIALGMHRQHTQEEARELVGDNVYKRVQVLNHSASPADCVHLGHTSAGTPVEINRHVVEAELRIATGNIEPHRLVGMSGGVKALFPGVASAVSIAHHHAQSQLYQIEPGDIRNPLHQDLLEVLTFVPMDFLFNVVVDQQRHIKAAAAGDIIHAHAHLLEQAKAIFMVPVGQQYDLVIASAGGYPKDLQLYQAVKTLQNASSITKPGGKIVLAAQCEEMFGNGLFQYWVDTYSNRQTIVNKLKQQFVLGPHKVEHIDKVLEKHNVYLYSEMPKPWVELLGFIPISDLQSTVDQLLEELHPVLRASIAVMPTGGLTFPVLMKEQDQMNNPVKELIT